MTRRIILVDIGAGLTLRGVLPSVALFADYTASLVASGGQAPYSYSLVAGALPDGLALDAATGIISGTAGVAGQSVFTVRVTDLSGAHVDRQFAITVIAEPLSLSGAAPAWTVGTPYSYMYSAAHGVPPYSWRLAAGALPAGLALNAATGEISGTPTAGNAPTWTVRVTDSAGASIDLRDNATLQLLGDFADATVGTAYSSDLLINGGDAPYSNPRVTVGALPAGLALSVVGDKLRLSGTPTAAATSNFTAAVDSADGQTAASEQSFIVVGNTIKALLHFESEDYSGNPYLLVDERGHLWTSPNTSTTGVDSSHPRFGDNSFKTSAARAICSDLSCIDLLNESHWTVDMWLYATSIVNDRRILSIGGGAVAWNNTNGIHLLIQPSGGRVHATIYTAAGPIDATGSIGFTANTQQHLEVGYEPGHLRIFLMGTKIADINPGTILRPSAAPQMHVGGIYGEGGNGWQGWIDELCIRYETVHTTDFTPPVAPYV